MMVKQKGIQNSRSGDVQGRNGEHILTTPFNLSEMRGNAPIEKFYSGFGQVLRIIFLKSEVVRTSIPTPPLGTPLQLTAHLKHLRQLNTRQ